MRVIAIGAAAMLLFLSSAQAQEWQSYSDPSKGFAIQFPGPASRQDQTEQMGPGPLQETDFSFSQGPLTFDLSVDDHSGLNHKNSPQAIIQGGLDAMERNFPDIHSKSSFKVPNGAGTEVLLSGNGHIYRIRAYYVAPYAYTLIACADTGASWDILTTGDAERFFNSFRLLK